MKVSKRRTSKIRLNTNVFSVDRLFGRASTSTVTDKLAQYQSNLLLCCKLFQFNTEENTESNQKAKALSELINFSDLPENSEYVFSDRLLHPLFQLFRHNLFRSFRFVSSTKTNNNASYDADDEEILLEPAWPHFVLVYQLLLQTVISSSFTSEMGLRYIDNSFIKQFIWLFRSEDSRERYFLKNILHRLYGKFVSLRPMLKTNIQNSLVEFVYENEENANGISELLEVFESIIDGYKVPLKAENITFLRENLIPLHKSKALPNFYQQLVKCLLKFLQKDNTLIDIIIQGLLKYWPISNCNKEGIYLNELEEILEIHNIDNKCAEQVFKRLSKCISSLHFQVAEKALIIITNDKLINILNKTREKLYPILIENLVNTSERHWNNYIRNIARNTLNDFRAMDKLLFEKYYKKTVIDKEEKIRARSIREDAWKQLEMIY